jgi:hypothetical protein
MGNIGHLPFQAPFTIILREAKLSCCWFFSHVTIKMFRDLPSRMRLGRLKIRIGGSFVSVVMFALTSSDGVWI